MFRRTIIFSTLILLTLLGIDAEAQKKLAPMKTIASHIAKGEFEVKVLPQPADENIGDSTIGRLGLEKTFKGGLTGVSKGQMLGSQSETEPGKGGYVAMERFVGTLDGKRGSFILQHVGTMDSSGYVMNIAVVPGSGLDELEGIGGKFTIRIEGKKHFYEFKYTLPKK
ncbi:MAG: DUF3224 domain-containing protein [Pyrinomonadaceae bacterium]